MFRSETRDVHHLHASVTSTMNMNDEDEAQSQSFSIGPKLSQKGGSMADCNSQAAATKATGGVV